MQSALATRAKTSTVGVSSYYGPGFNGRRTADGEIFDMHGLSAAHKTLPIPCYARVTNLSNGRSVVVRVNDRGPYVRGRMLDVSERVAHLLSFHGGMEKVKLDYLGVAGPSGAADQRALLASLKTRDEPIAVAAKPADDGVTAVARSPAALAYSGDAPRAAPAAAALAAVVKPVPAPEPLAPLNVAARLDASARQLGSALEVAHRVADAATQSAVQTLSPYGQLVVAPFKPLIEAAK